MAMSKQDVGEALDTLWDMTEYGVSFETFFKAVSVTRVLEYEED